MPVFTDQTGRSVSIDSTQRIISLVPSQTELLHDLGLGEQVIGITKFCVHPEDWFRTKTKLGGTKQVRTALIRELQPDLILANKEENQREQVEELALHFPVWISDVHSLEDAFDMIGSIGRITHTADWAEKMITAIQDNFSTLNIGHPKAGYQNPPRPRAAYLIWKNPWMTVGGDTFIHSMLKAAGFDNLFSGRTRYPETSIEEIGAAGCEYLLLSSEPFPFKKTHGEELQRLLPETKVLLVDGEMFSWYGSRMLLAPAYFRTLREQL